MFSLHIGRHNTHKLVQDFLLNIELHYTQQTIPSAYIITTFQVALRTEASTKAYPPSAQLQGPREATSPSR